MRLVKSTMCSVLCVASLQASAPPEGIEFTPEEAAWLATKPRLTVAADPSWPPFSIIDPKGNLRGIDRDLLDLISQRTGITFEVVPTTSWAKAERLAREGKVDVVTGTAQTPDREKFARFTRNYALSTVAVITRKHGPFLTTLPQLETRRVSLPRGYVTTEALAREYPAIQIVLTNTVTEALRAVEDGDAEATVANLTSANYTILSEGLGNLKIAGVTDYAFDMRLGVTIPGPALAVLDKTLASIPRREIAAIHDRWTGIEFQRSLSWRAVRRALLWAAAIAGAIVLLFVARNRALARELSERRKVERALSTANEALQTLNKEKSEMMQMLAHDLNNPLGALGMICESLGRRPNLEGHEQLDITMMQSAVARMGRLVSSLLSAEAMESGSRQLNLREIDLGATARMVVERLQAAAAAKKISVKFQERHACQITADALALDQIVENLVSNAIKFTPAGGSVEVSVEEREKRRELRVADTGPGIPEHERTLLFGKFARLSTRPTAGESSHGLGLMLVKRLATALGGTVHHEHRPGGGSVFVVTL